jgi:hypothetical protein
VRILIVLWEAVNDLVLDEDDLLSTEPNIEDCFRHDWEGSMERYSHHLF